MEFLNEKMMHKESDLLVKGNELERVKEENLSLKACVQEADKNREIMAR